MPSRVKPLPTYFHPEAARRARTIRNPAVDGPNGLTYPPAAVARVSVSGLDLAEPFTTEARDPVPFIIEVARRRTRRGRPLEDAPFVVKQGASPTPVLAVSDLRPMQAVEIPRGAKGAPTLS